jgi:hypothetical protein
MVRPLHRLLLLLSATACGRPAHDGRAPAAQVAPVVIASAAPDAAHVPLVATAPNDTAASAPFKSVCQGVELELTAVRQDGDAVAFALYLKNTGTSSASLMVSGDGSASSRRNPYITFSVTPNMTSKPGLCGLMNPLTEEDFVNLAPGAKRKLEWGYANTPMQSGAYTLQVTYRNDPYTRQHEGSAFLPRIRQTLACEVTSAKVPFTWVKK